MKQKIRRCPFCSEKEAGGKLKVKEVFSGYDDDRIVLAVCCGDCVCQGPTAVVNADETIPMEERIRTATKQATLYWNARAGRR